MLSANITEEMEWKQMMKYMKRVIAGISSKQSLRQGQPIQDGYI